MHKGGWEWSRYDYNSGKVKHSHKKKEIDALSNTQRIDLVRKIDIRSPVDMDIMATWVKHFLSIKVPFVVKRHETILSDGRVVKHLVLWKKVGVQTKK